MYCWKNVDDDKPKDFVSILGFMDDAGDFPPVRECYKIGNEFYFPALGEFHPVTYWTKMPEPPKGSDMKLSFSQNYIQGAFDVSIEALREKAEREKGCEYCNPNPYGHGEAIKQLITQIFNDKAHIHTFVRGNGLHTIAYPSPQDTNLAKTYSKCKIINYCPVCGKRLEVEE